MNKNNIEQILRVWFVQMTERYPWLSIKFEYSDRKGAYLVSFSPIDKIELDDDFNIEAMRFSDEMNALYGDDAPLFTDEEKLFQLSEDAEVISARSYFSAVTSRTCSSTPTVQVQPAVKNAPAASYSTTQLTNYRNPQAAACYAAAA